jgi:hypothetical protein
VFSSYEFGLEVSFVCEEWFAYVETNLGWIEVSNACLDGCIDDGGLLGDDCSAEK